MGVSYDLLSLFRGQVDHRHHQEKNLKIMFDTLYSQCKLNTRKQNTTGHTAMNFTSIIIRNVSTQTIVQTLPYNQANERIADKLAREWNMGKGSRMGLVGVQYK